LRGRYFWNMRTKQALETSVEYFQKAIEADPNYALAYVGLADSHGSLAYYAFAPAKESGSKSEAAVLKALALDDQLAEAHATLGFMRMMEWDWVAAEREFKRAIALNPSYAVAHNWYGLYWLFGAHEDKAEEEFGQAQQLDPASAAYNGNLGLIFCNRKQYERGITHLTESLRLAPDYAFSHLPLAMNCYLPRNMYPQAIDQLKQALVKSPTDSKFSGALAYTYARAGNRDGTLTILRELEARDKREDVATAIAYAYVGLDEKDRAFEWLEKAYQRRSPALVSLKVHRGLDPVRSDPRFEDLVRRVGFPP
jgi:Tfp pilus assembly protein PilF